MSSVLPEMIPVPGGSITLRDARTKTARTAELQGFRIVPYPVTWELYPRVLGVQAPGDENPDAPAHPVSWQDAVSWSNALSIASGLAPACDMGDAEVVWDVGANRFRLPTEAEWEWACRAGLTLSRKRLSRCRSNGARVT